MWIRFLLYGVLGCCAEIVWSAVTERIPWDYSTLRGNLHGLIAWEYATVWFAFGLALEPVHDFLVRLTPTLEGMLFG
jgi:hypothetical protein